MGPRMSADLNIRCSLCTGPIDIRSITTWRRMTGWERKAGVRASGKHGGSDVACREPLDEFAHDLCVRRQQQGLSPLQEALL